MAKITLPETCPGCGTERPSIKSREVMNGYIPIYVRSDDSAEFGVGEHDWESAQTQDYIWDCCHEEVSEELAQALDRALHNERWDVTWKYHECTEEEN